MTYFQSGSLDFEHTIANVTEPSALIAILDAGCAATIWERNLLSGFQKWIDGISSNELPRARVISRTEFLFDALVNLTEACGLSDEPYRSLLIDDASVLFSNIMNAQFLRLQLDIISTNACWKIYIDEVKARLICTYRGTRTHYGFPKVGQDPEETNTIPTGSPIILRGAKWLEYSATGLVHRSPPSEGTDETHLVLDPVDIPENENEPSNVILH